LTCSTWRGPITASTARLATAEPVPKAMPCTTVPMMPDIMPPPPLGAAAGGGALMGAAGGGAVVRAGMAGLEGAAAGAACLGAGLAAPVLLERGIVLCVDGSMRNVVYNLAVFFFRLRMEI